MDRDVAEGAIKTFLVEMGTRLEESFSLVKAAQACADGGNVSKAVEIVLDVEQLTYESSNLLNAVSMLNRLSVD